MLLLGAAIGHAQPAGSLDDAARRAVVARAAEVLRGRYVAPDMGERAADALETALAAGGYDELRDDWAFAQRVTADLQAAASDKHLRVTARGPAPRGFGVDAAAPARPRSEWGVVRADRLAGNVGYIELVDFPELELFQPPLDRAMLTLASTRALIIDARRHRGGGAAAEAYLVSYFLTAVEPVAVNRLVVRNWETATFRTQTFWSSPTPFAYIAAAAEDALAVALAELGVTPAAPALDALSVARLFEPRTAPQPESAVALRRVVDELARGELDYDLMSADWARLTRERQMLLQKTFEELGAVRAIAFEEVDVQGDDVYAVTFANASLLCSIALDAQGRTARFACSPPQ